MHGAYPEVFTNHSISLTIRLTLGSQRLAVFFFLMTFTGTCGLVFPKGFKPPKIAQKATQMAQNSTQIAQNTSKIIQTTSKNHPPDPPIKTQKNCFVCKENGLSPFALVEDRSGHLCILMEYCELGRPGWFV